MGYLGSKSTIYDRVIRGTPVRRFYGEENVVTIRNSYFPLGGGGGGGAGKYAVPRGGGK